MLKLMRFGVYFEIIQNKKCLFYIEIMISTNHMLRGSRTYSPENMWEKNGCNFMYILIRFCLKNLQFFM